MKNINLIHPDLQKTARILLTEDDTDFRKSLRKGTSLEAMLEKSRIYVTSRHEQLDDFHVCLYETRIKSSCCLDAVEEAMALECMTPAEFASALKDPSLLPKLAANCKCCGATMPIVHVRRGIFLVTVCGEPYYIGKGPMRLRARYLSITPDQIPRCTFMYRGKRIVGAYMTERRDKFMIELIQIW